MKDKPTYESYYENNNIEYQQWFKNNKLHRLNGPAYIHYHENGTIQSQSWWENGKCHRLNGLPASIWYYKNGTIEYQSWYENGKCLSHKEVLQKQYQWFNKLIECIKLRRRI